MQGANDLNPHGLAVHGGECKDARNQNSPVSSSSSGSPNGLIGTLMLARKGGSPCLDLAKVFPG